MSVLDTFKKKLEYGVWNVGIINSPVSDIINGKTYEIQWMKHHYHDRFFADPFLYSQDAEYLYIFAEELKFYEWKGRIVLLKVQRNSFKLVERRVIINEEYHLSYPNQEAGMIVPEGYQSGALYSYQLGKNKILRKKKILDCPLIDPTFVEHNGRRWLFGTTKEETIDAKRKLSIFYEEDGNYVPHKKNPVKVDIKTARPAGKFFCVGDQLYRPVQDSESFYGERTRIMKVNKLDMEDYIEEETAQVTSHGSKKYNEGLHTFNVYDGFIIVDGYKMKVEWQKILHVKFPELCKRLTDTNVGYSIIE